MSNPLTDNTDAQAPIRFSTMWRAMAIAGFGMLSFITMGFLTWGGWVTVSIISHGEAIAAFKGWPGNGVSQSVNVGQHDKAAAETSAKTWLTTKDVAAKEGVTERTVLNYIKDKMIQPEPHFNGKSYDIATNFRIIPKDSEDCGNIPQGP